MSYLVNSPPVWLVMFGNDGVSTATMGGWVKGVKLKKGRANTFLSRGGEKRRTPREFAEGLRP